MNERCDNCGHSPASHQLWGSGRCDAHNCTCGKYAAPSPWAADPMGSGPAADHQEASNAPRTVVWAPDRYVPIGVIEGAA